MLKKTQTLIDQNKADELKECQIDGELVPNDPNQRINFIKNKILQLDKKLDLLGWNSPYEPRSYFESFKFLFC